MEIKMNGAYEVIYTSSISLLNENQTDLGVLQATKDIPEVLLRGQSLHRSFPFSEIPHATTNDVPHKFVFRRLNGHYHLSHVIYAGADHTGRDAPYAHEIIIRQEQLGEKSEFDRCLPSDVFKHFHELIHSSEIKSSPKWLEPQPLPESLPKAGSQESLDEALKAIPEQHLVCILNAMASPRNRDFLPVIIDEAKWSESAADICYRVLRCLPGHLQVGVLAQPGSLAPNDIPQDINLILIPSNSPLSEDARQFKQFVDLTSKDRPGFVNVASPSLEQPHGYGTMFVRKRELVTRSTWNFFKLSGTDGQRDGYLVLQHQKAAKQGESSELLCCCQGLVNAKSSAVKSHFAKRLQELINKAIPVDQVPKCVEALRTTFPKHPEFARRLITSCEESLMNSDHLPASLEEELIHWLQEHSTGTMPNFPKLLLMKHVDRCRTSNKNTIIQLVTPPNSLSNWSDLIWGHDRALDKSAYVDEFANRIRNKRDVPPEIAQSEGCRRIVKKVLIDQEKYWMRRTSTGVSCLVNAQNQWEWKEYFRKFSLEPDRQIVPWWPVVDSYAGVPSFPLSQPPRHAMPSIKSNRKPKYVAQLLPIIFVFLFSIILLLAFQSDTVKRWLGLSPSDDTGSTVIDQDGAESQDTEASSESKSDVTSENTNKSIPTKDPAEQ